MKQAIIIESPRSAGNVRSAAALGTMTVGELRKALAGAPDAALVLINGTDHVRNVESADKRVWREKDDEWRVW